MLSQYGGVMQFLELSRYVLSIFGAVLLSPGVSHPIRHFIYLKLISKIQYNLFWKLFLITVRVI